MKSDQGPCSSLLHVTKTGTLNGVSSINFTVPAESLKSFSTYMDNKAYQALNTDFSGRSSPLAFPESLPD